MKRDNNASVRVASWLPSTESESLLSFSGSAVSDSGDHGLQQARLSCPPLSPGVCSNSYPLSQWCHPTIAFSVAPFSSCPQSFSASGSFPMSQLFASGGQSIGASASASVLPWIFRVDFTSAQQMLFLLLLLLLRLPLLQGSFTRNPKGRGGWCPGGLSSGARRERGEPCRLSLPRGSWSIGSLLPTAPYF